MGRKILGVIVGLIVGLGAVMAVHAIQFVVYPMPPGLDKDPEAFKAFMANLKPGEYAFVLAAHASGPFLGALICALIVRGRWWVGPIILGVLFTVAGLLNYLTIPAPLWFMVVDTAMYVPLALLGAWLIYRIRR